MGSPLDPAGYGSEQILATTLFRIYLSGGGGVCGLMLGLDGISFWVGNPHPRRAEMQLEVELPAFLRKRVGVSGSSTCPCPVSSWIPRPGAWC